MFLLLWLCGWTFGVITMGAEVFAHPDTRSVLVWMLMLFIDVGTTAFMLYSFFAIQELCIDYCEMTISLTVFRRLRTKKIQISDIRNVLLVEVSRGRAGKSPAVRVLVDGEKPLHFGIGAHQQQIVGWLRKIRDRLEKSGISLPADPAFAVAEQHELRFATAVREEAMKVAGVQSESELDADLYRRKVAVQSVRKQVMDRVLSESESADPPSIAARIGSYIAGAIWVGVGVIWILATVAMALDIFERMRWGMLLMLVPFAGFSVFFAIVIWAAISSAWDALRQLVRRAK